MEKTIPNVLSGIRIIAVPFLLYSSWMGYQNLFLGLLIISLLSDAIDGYVARKLNIWLVGAIWPTTPAVGVDVVYDKANPPESFDRNHEYPVDPAIDWSVICTGCPTTNSICFSPDSVFCGSFSAILNTPLKLIVTY